MAYFPNGTSGEIYEREYCDRCLHQGSPNGPGCSVMLAHIVHNYKECNNPDSILHLLIGRDDKGFPKKCSMFLDKSRWTKSKLAKQGEKLQEALFPEASK